MAQQQIIDKENTFKFISLILSSFYQGQILCPVPLRVVLSQTKFENLRQTICIFQALMMTENLLVQIDREPNWVNFEIINCNNEGI